MAHLDKKTRINLEKASVLLFDNSQPATDLLGQVFFGFGVRQPHRCSTIEEALALMAETDFELIVCDGDLPNGRAYEFVSQLRRSDFEPNRYCPVIIISGHTPAAHVDKARQCGANFVVTKPIRPMVLLERIFWVSMENRTFIEVDGYVGPDRRFQNRGPPPGTEGRRKGDAEVMALGSAETPNLSQTEIDDFVLPTRALI